MEEREILEPFELHYSDLISLSSDVNALSSSSVSRDEIERLDAITSAIMENLGPTGPGLIIVTGVPDSLNLRKSLLPLARDLALLNNEDRKRILKEHSLGSDVPLKNLDRCVSSFAMQLKYQHNPYSSTPKWENLKRDDIHCTVEECLAVDKLRVSLDDKFKNLGSSFRELGFCMTNLGLSLARICDRAIGGQELEQSLLESHAVKARLVHYHSALDTLLIKQSGRRNRYTKEHTNHRFQHYGSVAKEHSSRNNLIHEGGDERQLCEKHFELWQQWHYDYGIFTVLTSPMFLSPCCCETAYTCSCYQECLSPCGHTYLQIFDSKKNGVRSVLAPPESFIIQVGESADVLSRGKLCSTLHSVCRPIELHNLSRETFVVFLQPAWNKVFDISDCSLKLLASGSRCSRISNEEPQGDPSKKLTQQIHKIVPPLSSRLKNGMTFAEFSRETTKQYYGGHGLQSNR